MLQIQRLGLRAAASAITALTLLSPVTARALSDRDEARELLKSGAQPSGAVDRLSPLAASSANAELVAESALALAAAGLTEAALFELDRALILDASDDTVLFVASSFLASLGHAQAAAELSRPAPAWLGERASLPARGAQSRVDLPPPARGFREELLAASALMEKSRFATAVDRFARLTAAYPQQPLGWAGYAIALEKIGAFQTAAQAVGKELALTPPSSQSRAFLSEHQTTLAAMPRLEKRQLRDSLKGSYTAFLGGGLSGGAGSTASVSVTAMVGKFLTRSLNLSLSLGYGDSTKFNLGLTPRLFFPLPGTVPLNLTAGMRLSYSGASQWGLTLSPGLSFFLREGSVDVWLDLGVAGSQSGTGTLATGYTFYVRPEGG